MKRFAEQLKNAGFNFAVALATQAEIDNGAACGQLAIITEEAARG